MPRQNPIDPPTTPEEAEQYSRLFTLAEAALLTGKYRQQLQRWISKGQIQANLDDTVRPARWLLTGAQVAAIWRKPQRPDFVIPMSLAQLRERYAHKIKAKTDQDI